MIKSTAPPVTLAACLLLVGTLLSGAASATERERLPASAVASAHPLATEAGLDVLAKGGNAFDAAVATAAVLAVVQPQESGLGGGGFFLTHSVDNGRDVVIDGRETAPDAATGDMFLDSEGQPVARYAREGPLGAAIPGTPAALARLNETLGSRSLAENLAPAIQLARAGFVVDAALASAIRESASRLSPAARAVFMPQGRALREGERLRQPDLARTLEVIAERGAKGFYEGEVAARLRAGVFADGGIWRLADLERYQIAEREPARISYRGHRITTLPLPAAGGVSLAQMLGALEQRDWPPHDDGAAWHELIEVLRLGHRDLALHLGDPGFVDVPLAHLTDRAYIGELASSVGRTAAIVSETSVAMLEGREKGRDTTHFSIIDAAGNRVAATLSINSHFGSAYMPPGTGVILNNQMADFAIAPLARDVAGQLHTRPNHVQPHKRPLSTMTPLFIEGPRGVLVTGTPGGARALSIGLQTVLMHVNGLGAEQIVAVPRLHHQYLPNEVLLEQNTMSATQMQRLRQRGHRLEHEANGFGDMQVVHWDRQHGVVEAASDPRGSGLARVLKTH